MTLKNLLALLMALILALSCCAFAEEATDEPQLFDAQWIAGLELPVEDWMTTAESRALLATLLRLEASNCSDSEVAAMMDECSVPTLYIASLQNAEPDAILLLCFQEEESRLIQILYLPTQNQFSVSVSELAQEPAQVIAALEEEGLFAQCEAISFEELYNAALSCAELLAAE